MAMQQQMAQQAALQAVPDVVKRVRKKPMTTWQNDMLISDCALVHRALPSSCPQQ